MTVTNPAGPKRKAVDTSTRYDGVYARHQLSCAKALEKTRRCSCRPSYYGKVFDPAIGRYRVTKPRRPSVLEAKSMRDDLLILVRAGALLESESVPELVVPVTFAVAHA